MNVNSQTKLTALSWYLIAFDCFLEAINKRINLLCLRLLSFSNFNYIVALNSKSPLKIAFMVSLTLEVREFEFKSLFTSKYLKAKLGYYLLFMFSPPKIS